MKESFQNSRAWRRISVPCCNTTISFRALLRIIFVFVLIFLGIQLGFNAKITPSKRYLDSSGITFTSQNRTLVSTNNFILRKNSNRSHIKPARIKMTDHQQQRRRPKLKPSNRKQKHNPKPQLGFSLLETKLLNSSKDFKKPLEKLLVIITTWVFSEEKRFVHNNLARLWASWPKLVQPIIYLMPGPDRNKNSVHGEHYQKELSILKENGWIFRQVPKVFCGGVPVLRSMIQDAMTLLPNSKFYGYANGDILFDSGLVETLISAQQQVSSNFSVLVVGQRTNFNVSNGTVFSNTNSVFQASKKGSLMKGIAIDYFITDSQFPWHKVPELVIGRIIYDNWMVYFGISQGAFVIDATRTITALHQTTADGNAAGWRYPNRYCNKNTILRLGYSFHTGWGYTWCAQHISLKDPATGKIVFKNRRVTRYCKAKPQLLSTKGKTTKTFFTKR